MKRVDGIGRRLMCGALLVLSAFALLAMLFERDLSNPPEAYQASSAGAVVVTRLPVMPDNWLLNAGNVKALDELPNIGPTYAQRIVDNREAFGPFAFPEDVMEVKGVGVKTFQGIMAWLEEHPDKAYLLTPSGGD